ncbi:MAG TPA: DNA-processing protein DprA, partial [Acidimicrobiales bacterium]
LRAGGAPPVGVVGTGHACVYPREHADLWKRVAEAGLLLAEVPPHCTPLPFRFPARNRILAALADAVVVVESRSRGGSLITVEEAERRCVPVLAVPGFPGTRAAEGTNQLIYDGCQMVRDHVDVLVALGLAARPALAPDRRPPPAPADQLVLDLFGGEALDLEAVIAATGTSLGEAAATLARLEDSGHLERVGAWYQPVPVRR